MTTARSKVGFFLPSPLIVVENGISEYINGFVLLLFELSINDLKYQKVKPGPKFPLTDKQSALIGFFPSLL
jgi:hypothetical protein